MNNNKSLCPSCEKLFNQSETTNKHLPFCSERCQSIDLGKWVREEFTVSDSFAVEHLED